MHAMMGAAASIIPNILAHMKPGFEPRESNNKRHNTHFRHIDIFCIFTLFQYKILYIGLLLFFLKRVDVKF